MSASKLLSLLSLAALSVGCHLLPNAEGGSADAAPPAPAQKSEPVLYARDGSVVTPGNVDSMPRREVEGGEGSRAKILELYQRVVSDRDRLQLLVASQEAEIAQMRAAAEAEAARLADVEARLASAERSAAELGNQNLDLAARLTTAQIRRYEAERKWLEALLAAPARTVAALDPRASAPAAPNAPAAATPPLNPAPAGEVKPKEHH